MACVATTASSFVKIVAAFAMFSALYALLTKVAALAAAIVLTPPDSADTRTFLTLTATAPGNFEHGMPHAFDERLIPATVKARSSRSSSANTSDASLAWTTRSLRCTRYARGMTVREIQGFLAEMYAIDVSPDLISSVTDAVMSEALAVV